MATLGRLHVDLIANAQKFVGEMRDAESAFQQTSRKMNDIGRSLTASVTLPVVGVGAAAVKMAADAAESASKMEAVFGSAAQGMNAWVSQLRDTVPETTANIQEFSASIGAMLTPLEMSETASTDMTQGVVQLAADLASLNNVPIAEALDKLRAGLVGEAEPLRVWGVQLSAAKTEAKALELGLIEQGEALSDTAKIMANWEVILEETTVAHGDAANTAGSAANQMKFFWAEARELAAVVGGELLPVVTPLVSGLADLLKGLQQIDPAILRFTLTVAGLAAAIGPLLLLASGLATGLIALNPVVLAVAAGVALLGGAVAVYWGEQQRLNDEIRESAEAYRISEDAIASYRAEVAQMSEIALESQRAGLEMQKTQLLKSIEAAQAALAAAEEMPKTGPGGRIQERKQAIQDATRDLASFEARLESVTALLGATHEGIARFANTAGSIDDQISTVTDEQIRRSADLVESLRIQEAEQERLLAATQQGLDASAEVTRQIDTERAVRDALANAIEEDAEQVENLVRRTRELEEATGRVTEAQERRRRQTEEAARRATSIQALEAEVAAMRQTVGAAREGEAAMERLRLSRAAWARVQELGTDATNTERAAVFALAMDLEELTLEHEELIQKAGEAADSAKSFQLDWISAINAVGAGLGGIGQDLASIGVGALSGGLSGAFTAAAGVLGRLFGGGDERGREQARLAQEAERAAEALRQLTASIEDDIQVRRLVVEGMNDEADVRRLQINQEKEAGELAEKFEERFRFAPDEADAFIAEMESWDIGPEAVERQTARFADALDTYRELLETHDLEMDDLLAKQKEREEERTRELERQGQESASDFKIRSARLGGDDRGAFLLKLQRDQEEFLQTLQKLVDAGAITMEAFENWGDLLDAESTQAIKEFDQALLDAAQATREAQLAFTDALDIDILRQEGKDQEADVRAAKSDAERRIQEAQDLGFEEGDSIFDRIQTWLNNRLAKIAERYADVPAAGVRQRAGGLDVASSARRAVKRSTVVLGSAQVSDLLRRQLVVQETYLPFLRSIDYKTGGGVSIGVIDRGLGETHRHGSRVSGGVIAR